jgi:hypothetical protein
MPIGPIRPVRPINALGTFRTLRPFRALDRAHALHFLRALWFTKLREMAVLLHSLRSVTPDNISELSAQSVGDLTPTFPPVP